MGETSRFPHWERNTYVPCLTADHTRSPGCKAREEWTASEVRPLARRRCPAAGSPCGGRGLVSESSCRPQELSWTGKPQGDCVSRPCHWQDVCWCQVLARVLGPRGTRTHFRHPGRAGRSPVSGYLIAKCVKGQSVPQLKSGHINYCWLIWWNIIQLSEWMNWIRMCQHRHGRDCIEWKLQSQHKQCHLCTFKMIIERVVFNWSVVDLQVSRVRQSDPLIHTHICLSHLFISNI